MFHSGLLLAFVLLTLVAPVQAQPALAAEPLCFPDVPGVADCIDARLRPFWERNGGLAVFGYPIGPALPAETPSGVRTVQQFERYRLELYPENQAPYDVLLGRSGADRRAQLGLADAPAAPAENCRFFAETGHNLCGDFLAFWQSHGLELGDAGTSERESLALLGLPLSEAGPEAGAQAQWFERARMELRDGSVLLGLLNAETERALMPPPAPAGWVTVEGNRLVQGGAPIVLKGLNYYPAGGPWSYMWTAWDGPQVERELVRARRELGINVVRILVPYRKDEGWTDGEGNVAPHMLARLREMVQLAGQQQLKLIVTLFDWEDPLAEPGSTREAAHLRYLETVVGAFADDDRILAWDLHNEPDNYNPWLGGNAPQVVDWLARMADAVRRIDGRHPLTVGVGRLDSLLQAAPNGRTIAQISDILAVHSYDAAAYATLAADVRRKTGMDKPIVLEEFGWSSGPECRGMYFDETSQLYLYRKAMAPAAREGLAGVLSWWYQDPPATSAFIADENGFYGLYRRDGAPKPAIAPFRTMHVPPLPSATSSALPLTVAPPLPADPLYEPIVFSDGYVLRDAFKHFWLFFGGEATFGRPISHAYRDAEGRLVQYFERARFELNEAEHVQPIDPRWPEGQTPEVYLDAVHLTPLGAQLSPGRAAERVPDPQQPGVRYFPQTGHTLRGEFLAYWEQRGEIFFGPPIGEPYQETVDGRTLTVQYFMHWRFEQAAGGDVRTASLGVDALARRQCPRP